jgi:hypothetical protein
MEQRMPSLFIPEFIGLASAVITLLAAIITLIAALRSR